LEIRRKQAGNQVLASRDRSCAMIVKIAAAVAGLILLLSAAPASADDNDDVFMRTLNDGGIHNADRAGVINVGHKVCDGLADGVSPVIIAQALTSSDNPKFYLSQDQADFFLGASVGVYCPGYAPNLRIRGW
jgi:hypothetical protein